MADIVDLIRVNVRSAQERAREILSDPSTVVLDTETTGLADGALICDLAVIARGRTLINTLLNPGEHIPGDASMIHGIYDRHVKGKPTFEYVWHDSLKDILRESRVVIYNASYDLRIIGNEVLRLGEEVEFTIRAEDALSLYQTWYFGGASRSGRGQTKLTTPHCDSDRCIAAVSKHQQAGAHRAYADCLATVERLKIIADSCWLHDHHRKK